MKKQAKIYGLLILSTQISFSVDSLINLAKKNIFIPYKWDQRKPIIYDALLNNRLPLDVLVFKKIIIWDLDLSGMYLKNVSFIDCKFINVNLQDADLRDTNFEGSLFCFVNLTNAILYSPANNPAKTFRFDSTLSPIQLVKQYVALRKIEKFEECESLNKVLGPLKLKLENENLVNLNLTGINLENANLYDANLTGTTLTNANFLNANLVDVNLQYAQLSNNIFLPQYRHPEEIFELWIKSDEENKKNYQELINGRFNMFNSIPNCRLTHINWQNQDLRNVNFYKTQLQKSNFKKSNLQNANLMHANLQNCDLTKVNLNKANLCYANLRNSTLEKVNLKYAYLQNADLANANLIKAKLKNTNLQGVFLGGAKLSESLILPVFCTDSLLMNIYNVCEDPNAKQILREILIGKRIL